MQIVINNYKQSPKNKQKKIIKSKYLNLPKIENLLKNNKKVHNSYFSCFILLNQLFANWAFSKKMTYECTEMESAKAIFT